MICVIIYGASIAGLGLTNVLWIGVALLALSGAADIVSSVYRNTILQVATPDAMRGRLQGVFIVVVAGGPRLGDFTSGSVADTVDRVFAIVAGGCACMIGVLLLGLRYRGFARYDARHPVPWRARAATAPWASQRRPTGHDWSRGHAAEIGAASDSSEPRVGHAVASDGG